VIAPITAPPITLQEGGPGELVAATTAPGGEEVQTTCPAQAVRVTYEPSSAGPPSWWPAPAEHAGPHDVMPRLLEVDDSEKVPR
jgi:hypothetical protein